MAAPELRGRSYLREGDFSAAELHSLLTLALELKQGSAGSSRARGTRLAGRQLAILLEKPSTRTRLAFQVAAQSEGADVLVLEPSALQLGDKESVADTARVLGRMVDAIAYRGAEHAIVEELAARSGVPVYNALTDDWHPTQTLADVLTMQEHGRKPADALAYAFVGDLRFNMGRSLLMMGALMGSDVRLVGPSALAPPPSVVDEARAVAATSGARVTITDDLAALDGVDFIHTDVWVSMGEPPDAWAARVEQLRPYRVDRALLERTGNPDVRFMHCLPAFHDDRTTLGAELVAATGLADGIEVSDDVFESDASIVFDQAENRLHTARALLVATLGD